MSVHTITPLESIGFGGDGDQVDAFLALERHFDVSIDDTECGQWRTAGDVFTAFLQALPEKQRERDDLWPTFANIMCEETGADASRLGYDTLLLALPISTVLLRWIRKAFRHFR
ncbi:hypothetical protein [Novosphingobium colocasiae]|uniref:Uncharacterized protein n=1 Tax=Novosphingobium colocasiae TaxID=1256513 RepID=A0A918PBX5_9SPHN|nr:hypothetical protein [Novosphingobium colocasiae]GGY97830.1 hypothetical protein GCM10011614_11170 [Novosphingobium colocasiae]